MSNEHTSGDTAGRSGEMGAAIINPRFGDDIVDALERAGRSIGAGG